MDRGTVEVDVETEAGPDRDEDAEDAAGSSGRLAGVRGRLPSPSIPRPRLRRPRLGVFSPSAFATAAVLGVAAMLLGTLVPLPGSRFLLLFLATFAYGTVSGTARYVECAAAGAVAAGVGFLLAVALGGALVPVLAGYGPEIAGVGVTAGALVSLAGHYFGRDLRAGWVG
jgi:hypothetical protein